MTEARPWRDIFVVICVCVAAENQVSQACGHKFSTWRETGPQQSVCEPMDLEHEYSPKSSREREERERGRERKRERECVCVCASVLRGVYLECVVCKNVTCI